MLLVVLPAFSSATAPALRFFEFVRFEKLLQHRCIVSCHRPAKHAFECLVEAVVNIAHFHASPQHSFHRGHAFVEYSARNNPAEIRQIGVHVQSKSMHGNPSAHLHADCRDLLSTHPHTRHSIFPASLKPVLSNCPNDDIFETSQIPVQIGSVFLQIDNRVSDNLPGSMI